MNGELNFFQGAKDGLGAATFLNPQYHPMAPLIELPEWLNPFPAQERVRICMKAMYMNPALNLKLAPGFYMLDNARDAGDLAGVHTLVENSSGNMAICLAMLRRYFGINKLQTIVPADIAPFKEQLLHLLGVEVLRSTESPGGPSGIEQAKMIGQQAGFHNLAQYQNPANPAAHEENTAQEVWDQTGGELTLFAASLGTTGTCVGARNFLRDAFQSNTLRSPFDLVGALCAEGNAVPGVRSRKRLQEIGFDWEEGINSVEVQTRESYLASLQLIRSGFMAGPSSGAALVALLRFLEGVRPEWDAHRNMRGEVLAVFVAGDTPLMYIEKYSTQLNAEDFAL